MFRFMRWTLRRPVWTSGLAWLVAAALLPQLVACDRASQANLSDNRNIKAHETAWPHKPWHHARAYTFNFFAREAGVPLHVYTDGGGWSPYVVHGMEARQAGRETGTALRRANPSRKVPADEVVYRGLPVSREQAERALSWVHAARGTVEVSKCPFPRHAVVYFDEHDKPVASVNVCFECGDILVWPPYAGNHTSGEGLFSALVRVFNESGQLASYDRVFPLWRRLMLDELAMPVYNVGRQP